MRLYLAGSSHETSRVNAIADKLTAHGCRVVSTWHREVDRALQAGRDDRLDADEQDRRAEQLKRELRSANVAWLLYPRTASVGSYWEAGYADALLELGKLSALIVTGVGSSGTVFTGSRKIFRDPSDDVGLVAALRFAARIALEAP